MRKPAPKSSPAQPDLSALLARVAALEKALEAAQAENESLRVENKLLRQKVDFLAHKLFGKKSEKVNIDQMMLDFGGAGTAPAPAAPAIPAPAPLPFPKPRRARPTSRNRLPEHLPEERVILDPPEVIADPDDFKCIGEECHEELDVQPSRFFRRVIVRRKYVRKSDRQAAPVIVPAPKRLIDHSVASAGLLAHLMVGKYVDHLPLFRLSLILRRDGIELSRQILSEWMQKAGGWLEPVAEAVAAEIRATGYLQVDETMVRYLDPGHGGTRQGYLWTALSPGVGVRYEWHASRGAECLKGLLAGFSGIAQCDGYAAYPAYNKNRSEAERLVLAACWAHSRRKFFDAREESFFARWMIGQIDQLYRIETGLRERKAGPALRAAFRCSQSLPVMERMGKALRRQVELKRHLPQGMTGKAITYTLDLWAELRRYAESGTAEIDNNLVENAIRPTAIGKKNYLFFGSEDAGEASAAIYTVVGTCKMLGVDPQEYLRDVLTRLPDATNQMIASLTPARWKDARCGARKRAA